MAENSEVRAPEEKKTRNFIEEIIDADLQSGRVKEVITLSLIHI